MATLENGQFYYFLRFPGPLGLGHMGWGFRFSRNRYLFGSLENAGGSAFVGRNGDNDYWWAWGSSEEQMLFEMRTMRVASELTGTNRLNGYTHYKEIPVPGAEPNDAESASLGHRGYAVMFNNCLDNAVRIGDAYGVSVWSWSRHLPSRLNVSVAPSGYFFSVLHEYAHHVL